MATLTIDSIEGLADRAARVAAYRELLREHSSHSLAWFNLAVDEFDGGDRLTARRAALAALTVDPTLRTRLPERVRAHVEFGGYLLVREVHASATQLLYAGARADGTEVYLRSLRDRPHALALAAYQAHGELPVTAVELIAALGTVAVPGGETFQILEHQPGRPVGQLLRGDGPDRGFAVDVVPRIDGEVAASLALEVLEQMDGSKLDLNPDPDLWLRTRRGVISLGPPGWSPTLEWMAPEERDPGADQKRVEVYRAALLVWVALTGRTAPGLDLTDRRALPIEALPERYQAIGPTLAAAVATQPEARPRLETLIERLRAVSSSSVSGTRTARPVIPGYKIVRPVGEGGFGVVYEGLAPDGTRVAIKVLHPHLAVSNEARARFFQEAKVAATVEHPGVVHALASGSKDGTHFVVMEMVDGDSLDRHLATSSLTPKETVRLGAQVAAAVGAMHTSAHGVLHRDLKPANIMLAPREARPGEPPWTARVCDFGVAKLLGEPTADGLPYTQTGQWNGTPPYMAPEQWRQDPLDARTDIYALGCVLYEAVAGHPPFVGKPYELLDAHLHKPAPALPATVPPRLAAAIARMLAKEPADRFASMAEVEAVLADPIVLEAAPPVDKPVDKPPVDKPPVDKPPVDKPPVDKPPVDKPPVDKPPVDKPPVDKPPVDKPAVDTAPPTEQVRIEPRRLPPALIAGVALAAGGGLIALYLALRPTGGSDRDIDAGVTTPIDADIDTPAVIAFALRPELRADLTVVGWSRDSQRFAVEFAYRDGPTSPKHWRAIAEFDARTEIVLRYWDRSDPGYVATGEPGWGPRIDGPWPAAEFEPSQLVEAARLSIEFCAPASPRKAPTSMEPNNGYLVHWDRTSPMVPVPCARPEDAGLVVVRDRTAPWSRLLRYAYQASGLPGTGQLTPALSPDGRRIAFAVVDRSDDGATVAARVYTRVLGPQVMVVTDNARLGRVALARLEQRGIPALLRPKATAARRTLVATADGNPTAQEASVALRIGDVIVGADASDDLKWLDVILELGPTP